MSTKALFHFGSIKFISFALSLIFGLILSPTFAIFTPPPVQAASLGVHLLQPEEIGDAVDLFNTDLNEKPEAITQYQSPVVHYVTIPFPLDEPNQAGAQDKWQKFFDECQKHSVVPLVRLTTIFNLEQNAWAVPNRFQIVTALNFLHQLRWPQPQKQHLIVFNETNHHAEWGGRADPASYAAVLSFTSNWARSLNPHFYLLPAGLDLAAPNGPTTMEAFTYLDQMVAADPQILDRIDGWTSHSYPNPAFSSSPAKTGQNSLTGYQHEIAWLDPQTPTRTLPIYITETGWEDNGRTHSNLKNWYQQIWAETWSQDSRLVAVTPFLLRGAPGPFARFSLLDAEGVPTTQYEAFSAIINQNRAQNQFTSPQF